MGVFASDQHKPSTCYKGSEQADDGPSDPALRADPPTAPSDPEVMELEEDLAAEPTLQTTGERLTLTTSSMTHYRQTRQKFDASHVAPSPSFL